MFIPGFFAFEQTTVSFDFDVQLDFGIHQVLVFLHHLLDFFLKSTNFVLAGAQADVKIVLLNS